MTSEEFDAITLNKRCSLRTKIFIKKLIEFIYFYDLLKQHYWIFVKIVISFLLVCLNFSCFNEK